MVRKIFVLILFVVTSSLFATTHFRFQQDTTLNCGLLKNVPVTVESSYDSSGTPPTAVGDTLFKDSLGRLLKRNYLKKISSIPYSHQVKSSTFIGTNNDIIIRYTTVKSSSPASSSVINDTLIGELWNEKGEILEGRIYRVKDYNPGSADQKSYADTFLVKIAYDSTGVIPVDTVNLDSSGFVPDTMITCGALEVAVRHYYTEEASTTPGISENYDMYRDSLGRWLLGRHEYRSSKGKFGWEKTRRVLFDDSGNIQTRYTTYDHGATNTTTDNTDTLDGILWNSMGMITKGYYRCSSFTHSIAGKTIINKSYDILYGYDSTGVVLIDSFQISDSGFQPDTLIDLQIAYDFYPVTREVIHEIDSVDSLGNVIEETRETICRDSLSRIIKSEGSRKTKYSGSKTIFWVSFDQYNRIDTTFKKRSSASIGGSSSTSDTLIGTAWNSVGMIKKGIIRQRRGSSHQGKSKTSDTVYAVEIIYDSTGVHPIDTISSEITAIVETSHQKSSSLTIAYSGTQLSITGLRENERVTLFDVKGRVLFSTCATVMGRVHIPGNSLARGIAILQTETRVLQLRL